MTAVPYWHLDAFADSAFGGNQAAVMILEAWPEDALLAAIGAENLFAETAFLVLDTSGAADWELRWFTPEMEIRLCGHATLAAGAVLLGREPERASVTFATRLAGVLEVRRAGAGFEVALPLIATAPGDYPAAVSGLGKAPREIWRSPDRYSVFFYESEAEVRALAPDMAQLAGLGDDQFIATAPGDASDIVSRVFVPGGGVPEDSATGSAHAVLAPLWCARLGRESFSAVQASARGARFACRREGGRVWLGGGCVMVVEGTFHLP